ncbi:SERTA domain-containing protein 2 [Portunus trituberculatus]|uniref:SERTA domain-containing protein 2 n=1 Tax=Portunus trituberculatus TaxID=210409 RepID=A0A5B7CUK2_PORTR|nr:SERTA domain-containing protein 2 [Portunus trituberculatus]
MLGWEGDGLDSPSVFVFSCFIPSFSPPPPVRPRPRPLSDQTENGKFSDAEILPVVDGFLWGLSSRQPLLPRQQETPSSYRAARHGCGWGRTGTTGTSTEDPSPKTLPSEGSITTVTATQTSTVVTSTYQGALSSPVYEPHPFYPGESYPSRPSTPTWESCNYYDGSQPTTNKYMEISPNKSTSSQSIQCDENGKSYLELGSASPYTHTYSSDCGNYTTSPSSYPAQSYNQTYTSPSSYGQPSSYYGPRQSYSPGPYVYPTGENYTTFEGENGCSYNYTGNAYGSVRGSLLPSRGPPRCMSPYCDPTRSSPRPSCYHQQRLSVLNMSMYKLNRFRQFPDPSLHRSVLICNTLRHIERELEAEGVSVASLLAHSHGHPAHPHLQGTTLGPGSPPCPEPMPSSSPSPPAATETPLSSMHTPPVGSPLATPSTPPPSTPGTPPPATHYSTPVYPTPQYLPTDHASGSYDSRETVPVHMRAYPNLVANTSHEESREGPSGVTADTTEGESSPSTPAPRPTPGPQEERTDAINWCSVLSLSSQTDLDSMNNNEYGEWSNETGGDLDYNRPEDGPPWKLPSLSAEDVLKSFPEASKRLEANEDLDSIINVLESVLIFCRHAGRKNTSQSSAFVDNQTLLNPWLARWATPAASRPRPKGAGLLSPNLQPPHRVPRALVCPALGSFAVWLSSKGPVAPLIKSGRQKAAPPSPQATVGSKHVTCGFFFGANGPQLAQANTGH